MTRNILDAKRLLRLAIVAACLETVAIMAMKWVAIHPFLPYLFRRDLGIPTSSNLEGIDKFAAFMASLSSPLLVALAAVAPLALMFGAGLLMVGHRRAGAIIASTVGALALAACATGLVN